MLTGFKRTQVQRAASVVARSIAAGEVVMMLLLFEKTRRVRSAPGVPWPST
jgi:hypothetical protein